MPDYCDECFFAKDDLCPTCQEEFICGVCETECLRCYLHPRDEGGEDGCE